MPDKLLIKGAVLSEGLAAIKAAAEDFKSAKDEGVAAAEACGHENLANSLRNAANSWEVRRGKLVKAMDGLSDALQSSIDTFGDVDRRIAEGLTGNPDQSPQTGGKTEGGATGTGGGAGGNSGSNIDPRPGTPTQPAPTHPGPAPAPISSDAGDALTTPSSPGAGGHQQPASVEQPTQPPTERHPDTPPSPISGDAGVVPPATTPGEGRTAPPEAQLLQTVATLWARWSALGGSKESMVAALTALGMGSMLVKLGLSKDSARPAGDDRSSKPGIPPAGSTSGGVAPPVDAVATPGAGIDSSQSVDGLPAPIAANEGAVAAGPLSGQSGAPASPDGSSTAPIGSTPEMVAAAPIESDLGADSGPQASSPDATPLDISSLAAESPRADGTAGTPIPVDLPPLIQADQAPAGRPSDQARALPSLDAGSSGSVNGGPVSGASESHSSQASMMPSLALGGMAAMGGNRTAAAPITNLPNLAPGVAGEDHKHPRGLHPHDARKILDDLGNRDGQAEES